MEHLRAKDIPSVDPTGAGLVLEIVAQGERILRELYGQRAMIGLDRKNGNISAAEEETLP